MTHKLIWASTLVFAVSGLGPVAHATSLADVCNTTIEVDTSVESGTFNGNCNIKVNNAKLEIVGVTIDINGELKLEDVSGDEGAAELDIQIAEITITTADRLEVEGAWDRGVTFEYNLIETAGNDLRLKPIGSGDLIVENNRGTISGDIRLGDDGLQGDIVARNNSFNVAGDFRAQSTNGNIEIRNNAIGGSVSNVQIVSASGDINAKSNQFPNTATAQEITINSEDGDVRVRLNTFGASVGAVSIDSTTGLCESDRNVPDVKCL